MTRKYYTKEWEDKIREACKDAPSMAHACADIQMNTNTFIFHAKRLKVYNPNQAGKGMSKFRPSIPLTEIIEGGKHPQYQAHKLKLRLLKEGIKEHVCEKCRRKTWQKKPIPLELHHKDGNSRNHLIGNISLICPNCHTFTDTYKSKNHKV